VCGLAESRSNHGREVAVSPSGADRPRTRCRPPGPPDRRCGRGPSDRATIPRPLSTSRCPSASRDPARCRVDRAALPMRATTASTSSSVAKTVGDRECRRTVDYCPCAKVTGHDDQTGRVGAYRPRKGTPSIACCHTRSRRRCHSSACFFPVNAPGVWRATMEITTSDPADLGRRGCRTASVSVYVRGVRPSIRATMTVPRWGAAGDGCPLRAPDYRTVSITSSSAVPPAASFLYDAYPMRPCWLR